MQGPLVLNLPAKSIVAVNSTCYVTVLPTVAGKRSSCHHKVTQARIRNGADSATVGLGNKFKCCSVQHCWLLNVERHFGARVSRQDVSFKPKVGHDSLPEISNDNRVRGPLLLSSDRSSWLQIQRSRFDSRRYQIF
jgi:hypothetical protein